MNCHDFPYLGHGLGFRFHYREEVLSNAHPVDWFEIMTEDYFSPGGPSRYYLDCLRERYPIAMHGVSMSVGSTDPLDYDYLKQVKQLADRISPAWISDHLCWTGLHGIHSHDLLPLPYTEESIARVATKVRAAQTFLERPLLLENVSSYVTYKESCITEWEFFVRVVEEADCYMLLDVNNIYVSAYNHQFDPLTYLDHIPKKRVKQLHLAGHDFCERYIIDTHSQPIINPVWDLYRETLKRFGLISTLIERDDNFPPFSALLDELHQARTIADNVTA